MDDVHDFISDFLREQTPEEVYKAFGCVPIMYAPHRNVFIKKIKNEKGEWVTAAEPIDSDKPVDLHLLQDSCFKPDDSCVENLRTVQQVSFGKDNKETTHERDSAVHGKQILDHYLGKGEKEMSDKFREIGSHQYYIDKEAKRIRDVVIIGPNPGMSHGIVVKDVESEEILICLDGDELFEEYELEKAKKRLEEL